LLHPYVINDVGTGLLGAFAVSLGVFERYRTGVGQHVGASLTQTAALHQGAYMLSYPGSVSDEPSGVNARGWNALHRMYAASDGWFFLGARADQADAVAKVVGLNAGRDAVADVGATGKLARALETTFATRPHSIWVQKLNAADIGSHAIQSQIEAAGDVTLARRGVVLGKPAANEPVVRSPGIGPWLTRTPPRPGSVEAPFGFHTEAILTEVGLASAIPQLVADGAASLVGDD